jgi:hypothetical protein
VTADPQTLIMEWTKPRSRVEQPSKEGFGGRVLKQAVSDGKVTLCYYEEGFFTGYR